MGKMIEQIWSGKTRNKLWAIKPGGEIWTRSADHHTGQQLLKWLHRKS